MNYLCLKMCFKNNRWSSILLSAHHSLNKQRENIAISFVPKSGHIQGPTWVFSQSQPPTAQMGSPLPADVLLYGTVEKEDEEA